MKHTPGEWFADKHYCDVRDGKARQIVRPAPANSNTLSKEEKQANACLISAAPELLRELKHILELYQAEIPNPGVRTYAAERAIAKAEGLL